MRAAVAHAARVPAGVDLAPPVRWWSYSGGAYWDPEERCAVLPAVGARIETRVRVDSPAAIAWTVDAKAPEPTGWLVSLDYLGPDMLRLGGNGQTREFVEVDWRVSSGSVSASAANRMAEAVWCRFVVQVSSLYSMPGVRYRSVEVSVRR
ncbi:hypothetical protein GCM10027079_02980 [Sediminivirga luteola]|uniref:Uncharacterized protein n=1 Tax=Sediminivirga luteola TaxID=1774748 RepID=A0A8J2TWW9_9MICO|nr:hypothetical protein GCM10011333_11670 [Sediminivirga luteola]